MQVVQDNDHRSDLRDIPHKGRGRLEKAKAGPLRLQGRRFGKVREELAQLGQELGKIDRAGAELNSQSLGIGLPDVSTERLYPGPVGGSATRLPTTTDKHTRTPRPSPANKLLRNPALTDPRLTHHQKEPTAASKGFIEASNELAELTLTADQDTSSRISDQLGRSPVSEVEGRILVEDRLVQLAQRTTRLNPQLLNKRSTSGLIDLERLRLTPRTVERQHELATQPLAKRMLANQPLKLTNQLGSKPRSRFRSTCSSRQARRSSSRRAISA
jgi:hypothetical protein